MRITVSAWSTRLVEGDDLAAVDRHPVPGLQVRAEGLGDRLMVSGCLRPLQLVEMRELGPRDHGIPQPQRRLADRWIDEHRPEQALPVREEQRGHAIAVSVDDA